MKISVITATYNAMAHLPVLVESLRGQTDKYFEWVVADGASTDGTVEYLKSIVDLNVKVISQEDFGIYDALNRGIKACSGEFYLVMGADDILYANAIQTFRSGINKNVDIVTATIDFGDYVSKPRRRMSWLYGQFSFVSGHAVGSLFRKSLHDVYGYYSKRFPIAADQHFILKAVKGGAKVKFLDEVLGKHELLGVSACDSLGTITEWYRVQVDVGFNRYIQTLLVLLRIIKYTLRS